MISPDQATAITSGHQPVQPSAQPAPQAGLPGQATSDSVTAATNPQPVQVRPPQSGQPQTMRATGSAPATASVPDAGNPAQPHSILGSIALGALKGMTQHLAGKAAADASRVGGGVKQAFKNFAANSPRGQELQTNALNRQIAQNKESREQDAAMDEATLRKLNIVKGNIETHRDTLANQKTEQELTDSQNATRATFYQFVSENFPSIVHHEGHDETTPQDGKDAGNGTTTHINNGQTGDKSGFGILDTREMMNSPLPVDFQFPASFKDDGKGHAVPDKMATIPAGESLGVAYAAQKNAQTEQDAMQKSLDQKQKDAADLDEKKSTTNKNNAEAGKVPSEIAKNSAETSAANARADKDRQDKAQSAQVNPPGSAGLTGEAYLKTLPAGEAAAIRAVAEGREVRSARQLQDKNGNATPFAQQLHLAYPDFDDSKAGGAWTKARNEYMGTGQTAKKVVSYNTSMEHMKDLYDSSTFAGLYEPLSADYQKRQASLGFVANEVGNAIKTGTMTEGEGKQIIAGLKGMTPNTSRQRIQETAKLLHDKTEEYQTKFQDAAPSQSVHVPTLLSPKAAAAYDYVQSGGKSVQPSGQAPAPSQNTQQMVSFGGKQFPVAADGTLQVNGQTYKLNPDGKGATLVQGQR